MKMKKTTLVLIPSAVLLLWLAFSLEAVTDEAGVYSVNASSSITQNQALPLSTMRGSY